MIDLKQLLDEWKDDCKISEMHLDETSRQVPILHSKYLEKLMNYLMNNLIYLKLYHQNLIIKLISMN